MNQLDKLFDIFKKSGEGKIIVLDRQSEDFYVLTKWDDYEKLLGADGGQDVKKVVEKQVAKNIGNDSSPVARVIAEETSVKPVENISVDNVSVINNISDEERFFLEPNV